MRRALGIALLGLAAAALAAAGAGSTLAAFGAQTTNAGSNVTAASDFRAPTLTPIVIAKTTGGSAAGSVRPGATYRVYATVADSGSPPSGVTRPIPVTTTRRIAHSIQFKNKRPPERREAVRAASIFGENEKAAMSASVSPCSGR